MNSRSANRCSSGTAAILILSGAVSSILREIAASLMGWATSAAIAPRNAADRRGDPCVCLRPERNYGKKYRPRKKPMPAQFAHQTQRPLRCYPVNADASSVIRNGRAADRRARSHHRVGVNPDSTGGKTATDGASASRAFARRPLRAAARARHRNASAAAHSIRPGAAAANRYRQR